MIENPGISLKTVFSYAQMSNGQAERRVGTIERAAMVLDQYDGRQ